VSTLGVRTALACLASVVDRVVVRRPLRHELLLEFDDRAADRWRSRKGVRSWRCRWCGSRRSRARSPSHRLRKQIHVPRVPLPAAFARYALLQRDSYSSHSINHENLLHFVRMRAAHPQEIGGQRPRGRDGIWTTLGGLCPSMS